LAEELMVKAKRGIFEGNPRLRRRVVCQKCGLMGDTYIDCLKKGKFEIYAQQQVLVTQPGYYGALKFENELVTPISLKWMCPRCGCEAKVTDPILTLEYLHGISKRSRPTLFYA
jgi:hypothetical protein